MAKKIEPNRTYGFNKLKKGQTKHIAIPRADAIAGQRARTAAYAYARRHNEKAKRKSDHIQFAGRVSADGKTMQIRRVL